MADFDCNGEADGFAGMAPYKWMNANWRIYLHSPEALERFPVAECSDHDGAGIYFLWDINGSLLYVGKSVCIGSRIFQHSCDSMAPAYAFSYFAVAGFKRRDLYLDKIESAYIHALGPAFNVQYRDHAWDCRDQMVRAIEDEWRTAHKHPPIIYMMQARGGTAKLPPYVIAKPNNVQQESA